MLFKKFNFNDPFAIAAFKLKSKKHKETWDEYYDSYCFALYIIIEKGLKRNYALNSKCKAILFLFRHSLELCLKSNLSKKGNEIILSHNFEDIFKSFTDKAVIPTNFLTMTDQIDFDEDGSCFRYHLNKDKRPYFNYSNKVEFGTILNSYLNIDSIHTFKINKISEPHTFDDNRIRWDLTFHLGEANQIGQIRTQYDECVEFLIEAILLNNREIDKLYIPLLFLIRHSLELALKGNIFEVQKISSLIKSKDYSGEHSLSTLFNCYLDFLNKVENQIHSELKTQLTEFKEQYRILNETVHQLDNNSRFFRYPTDKKGNAHHVPITNINFIQLLELYYFTDPFITFTNDVLIDDGVL